MDLDLDEILADARRRLDHRGDGVHHVDRDDYTDEATGEPLAPSEVTLLKAIDARLSSTEREHRRSRYKIKSFTVDS